MDLFEGMCGKVAPGLCRLSAGGGIAVKTSAGYRTYDVRTGRLTNCDHFVLDTGDDFFFVVPVNRVRPGDIILCGGKPRCVTAAEKDRFTAVNFEDATVETVLPERHLFMGNAFLCGKIVSLFGRNGVDGKKGMGRMMKYMMLSALMKGKDGGAAGLLPLLFTGGNTDFLDGLFDGDSEDGEADEEDGKKEEA